MEHKIFFKGALLGLVIALTMGLGLLAWSGQRAPRFVLAAAQATQLNWWTMDSGGGTSDSSNYSLAGTLGQADAGPPGSQMSGGSYDLEGGFWPGVASQYPPLYLPVVRR
jgi:hypothetical protein